jgi:hypothetical protein
VRELFIYYRVRGADAAAVRAAVLAAQQHLRDRHPGLRARLLRRPEETDGLQTWMETYSTDPMEDPAGITAALQADIESSAQRISHCVEGSRHTEVFIACAS